MINCKNLLADTNLGKSEMIDPTPDRGDNRSLFGSSKPAGFAPAFFLHMTETVEATPEPKSGKPKSIFKAKPRSVGKGGSRKLTIAQKAEIAALYRTGSFTIADLATKFDKNPATIALVIKQMGVTKGEAAEIAAKKMVDAIEERVISETEETLRKIAETKRKHFAWQSGLAALAIRKLTAADNAGVDIASLKDLMATLKMAGDVVGGARKELFAILNVERHEQERTTEELPELTVRELTSSEITQLQAQLGDELDLDEGMGADMLPDDPAEGF